MGIDKDLIALLELGYPDHKERQKVFVAEDSKAGVSLRKSIYLKAPSS